MPPEARLLAGLAVALTVVYSATPLVIRVADRLQFYDQPIGYKGHRSPTPYLGGAAVMAGFVLALLLVSTDDRGRTLPLLGGMAVLWAVGTIDDRRNVSPGTRVVIEAVLAGLLWNAGLGWDLGLGGGVDLALTVLWILAVVNAFNLFDNMDGAASVMALVVCSAVVAMGLVQGDAWLSIAGAALCGACLGFLPHNLASPARIFLGDGGSMPIGFAVAVLVMVGSADAVPAWQALVVGLLLVAVPALDTCLVMVSRRRRGVSILTAGRDHLTHRTQRWLRTARGVAVALGAVQALVAALALFAITGGAAIILLVVVLYLVAAATAIALLEAADRDALVAEVAPATTPGTVTSPRVAPPPAASRPAIALVLALGAVMATSPFLGGFYDTGRWLPLGLALLAVSTAAAIARPPHLSRNAQAALLALGGLAAWALLSSAWAPSIFQATTEANRTFVLATILATALVTVRTDVLAGWLTGGLIAGIGAVAVWVIVQMLGSDPNALFLTGRLDRPLGYINGQGTVFVMGFWLCLALAERRPAWLGGAGAGAATLMLALAFMTQSRGAAVAMLASTIIVVALVPGSRLRRVFAIAACAAGVAAVSGALLGVYDAGAAGPVTAGVARPAALAVLGAALAVGLVWAGSTWAVDRATSRRPTAHVAVRRGGLAALAVAALIAVGGVLVSAGRIESTVSEQWAAFTSLGVTPGNPSARLASGAGTRYDYWRVALDSFAERPLLGTGAGNYDRRYYQTRRTTEDIRQPHSIELQALSELGIVGGALLAVFLAALAIGAWRMRPAAAASPAARTLMVGAVGVLSAWLVHTSVDWIHLMPGVTGIALVMAAILLRHGRGPRELAQRSTSPALVTSRPVRLAGAVAAGLALVVAGASLSRQGLADLFYDRATDALADRPADAIREANSSLRLDAENPRTYYVKAAALARFNQADAARRTLLLAAGKEPDDFVTWTLLGDLAIRRGRVEEARRNYARASALNPVDAALRKLAADPRSALPGTSP